MNTKRTALAVFMMTITLTNICLAQTKEVIKDQGYELTVINQDASFNKPLKENLIKTFFSVYPKLAKAYNSGTLKKVTFVIDTAYKGVAATANGRVSFSAKYMSSHVGDIDVVTHEVMHIVQDYGNSVGPWWLTEGIADYARYSFGVDNKKAEWSLPPYQAGQKYDNGYRVTARFLLWIEKTVKKDVVKALDQQLRLHTFKEESWRQLTGKTADELWAQYISSNTSSLS